VRGFVGSCSGSCAIGVATVRRAGPNTFTVHLPSVKVEQFARMGRGCLDNGTVFLPGVRHTEHAMEVLILCGRSRSLASNIIPGHND
jgi:hypothetical protein